MEKVVIDQMGREVTVPFPPLRIISLVPSQTELLFHLGLDEEVVGLTKFCVHPEDKWRSKPRIGGTKKLHLDRIAELGPDLIVGNKEENERTQIEALEKDFAVWMSDVQTIEAAMEMITSVAEIIGRPDAGLKLVKNISSHYSPKKSFKNKPQVAYLIWRNPWMVAAPGTFIDSMLEFAGFKNVFTEKTRYPEVTLEELSEANPDVIMLSSEPYPFKEQHIEEIKKHCRCNIVKLVDGELFSWYGSRMLKAVPYFDNLRHEISSMLSKQ